MKQLRFMLAFALLLGASLMNADCPGSSSCCVRPQIINVPAGQSIQAGINAAKVKDPVPTVIALAPGATYTENFVVSGITDEEDTNYLVIQGDTRAFVGTSYVSGGFANPARVADMGAFNGLGFPPNNTGLTTLTSAGNTITVTVVGGNPDFVAAGVVVGDSIIITDPAAAYSGERAVTAVSGNTVTFSGAAINFSGNTVSSTLTFLPNVNIVAVAPATGSTVHAYDFRRKSTLQGVYIKTPATGQVDAVLYTEHNLVRLKNIVINDPAQNAILINAQRAGMFVAGDNFAAQFPFFINGGYSFNPTLISDNNVQYPITLINGNVGAFIDSLAELTAAALVAISQKSAAVSASCESHCRINQVQIAHIPSFGAIVGAENSFMSPVNGFILGNAGATAGIGIFGIDRAAFFATQTTLQNMAIGIQAADGSFADASLATFTNMGTGAFAAACSCIDASTATFTPGTVTVPKFAVPASGSTVL